MPVNDLECEVIGWQPHAGQSSTTSSSMPSLEIIAGADSIGSFFSKCWHKTMPEIVDRKKVKGWQPHAGQSSTTNSSMPSLDSIVGSESIGYVFR